jgi:hypothetical protein
MPKRRIPIVRNSSGVRSRFSVNRYASDAIIAGTDREAAFARARRLLKDLLRNRATVVTTDDLRHWTLEQDPLVFAHRRGLRETNFDGSRRFVDPGLGRIAALAALIAPRSGRVLTELFLDYFRPGSGDVLFLMAPDDKAPPIGELEGSVAGADAILYPGRPDFSKPGQAGTPVADVFTDRRKRFLYYIQPDDSADRTGFQPGRLPGCSPEIWLFRMEYMRMVRGCANVQYERLAREARIQAFAEMFNKLCPRNCPLPAPKIRHIQWFCDEDVAHVIIFFEVECTVAPN